MYRMLATIRLWHYILGNNKRNHFLSIFFMLRTVIKSKDPYIFIIPICIKNIVKTTLLWSRTTVVYTLTCNVNRTKLFHDRMRLLKNRTASKRLMSESRYINRVYDLFRSNGDRRPIRIIVVLSKLVSGRLSNTWDEIYIYIILRCWVNICSILRSSRQGMARLFVGMGNGCGLNISFDHGTLYKMLTKWYKIEMSASRLAHRIFDRPLAVTKRRLFDVWPR